MQKERDDSTGSRVLPYYFPYVTKVSFIVTTDGYLECKYVEGINIASFPR